MSLKTEETPDIIGPSLASGSLEKTSTFHNRVRNIRDQNKVSSEMRRKIMKYPKNT